MNNASPTTQTGRGKWQKEDDFPILSVVADIWIIYVQSYQTNPVVIY